MTRPLILVTNDDGIRSPGLVAAVEAVYDLGEVVVVAPRRQQTSMGRAFPRCPEYGAILPTAVAVNGTRIGAHMVEGAPATTVCHAILEVAPRLPALCVSGVNYGENVGTSLTASGTLGAAFQADALGVPAIAVSVEYDPALQGSEHYADVDFTAARYFTRYVARRVLAEGFPVGVSVLNVNIPNGSSCDVPIRTTVQSRQSYYVACHPGPRELSRPVALDFCVDVDFGALEVNSDIHALKVDRVVSVTPLTWSMTADVPLTL